MERVEIEKKIRRFVVESEFLSLNEEDVKDDSSFYEDLGLDSLDHVNVIMKVESEFQIVIPDEAVVNLMTFKQLVDYVESVMKQIDGLQV